MHYRIDDEARLFHLDLNCGITAERALDKALTVIEARPELWRWDWIVDARVTPEDASFHQIARLARAFDVRLDNEVLTMLVTHDSYLHLWARVMDFQFPRRRHLVVATPEAAMRRIEHRQAQRR
ncbi:hypothetical protein [Brevundimonas sp.]|uniref:hypothetical protein n=1 Tax=Brevundimonas sp. TaxID=1871086 RepID=UPI0037C02AED